MGTEHPIILYRFIS